MAIVQWPQSALDKVDRLQAALATHEQMSCFDLSCPNRQEIPDTCRCGEDSIVYHKGYFLCQTCFDSANQTSTPHCNRCDI